MANYFAISISVRKANWTSQIVEASSDADAIEKVQASLPDGWVVITVAETSQPRDGILFGGVNIEPFLPDLSI